ncbi:DNA-3-methyladenine glycosylase I [Thalassobium sp. R2A62]|jgi:3-methyladenine DNA glycosylase Tag|uniref:DNA-3-methyladenine glycosylase I n=1 Tax=Thalassobium sp. R2A62 TaxID=633131 RepID=UPI0001B1CF97|nr:DNA-3-methyladenine glycosylase I [Thalassobium sp. R2A62]EET46695.1 3-methyl-adenine DNA glycosylase [Thalassobium sp. R2A62]MDG1339664.1 DNA-3-methyladenine glycosylase I [Paracoccaceae bacterium]MDG1802684.1 DNA-3-methyladenine glycosylase I [Paracoccaceae bacterium]MDG2452544.1 DNA-3-methyladenine glycosylase I [Paracoccaceae bacterium]
MRSFDAIYDIAAERKGGAEALEEKIGGGPLSPDELILKPGDRWLSTLTNCVFQAGFNWKVVDAMWDGFEEAFFGFDLGRVAMLHDEMFDALITNTAIVRHGPKIRAVQENAVFLLELQAESGSVGAAIAQWPNDDFVGLLAMLKKRGTRLGGMTGQYAMRFAKRDGFILSRDVVARLVAEGVVDGQPTSKRALAQTQEAFNTWADQSGRSLIEISRVVAMSV